MEWQQLEIKDFLGRQTSSVTPLKNACQVIENFDVRNVDGQLESRYGYDRLYAKPTDSRSKFTIPTGGYLSFANFYIPELGGGKEVTVQIAKGTLAGETTLPIGGKGVPDSINILSFWICPWYNPATGTWVTNSWQWLNQCVLTKINAVNASTYKLELDFSDATLKADGMNKWSIINLTKSPKEVAKVINTYAVTSDQVGVEITRSEHTWAAGDVVLLMKNYIPYDYLIAMYSVTTSDIVYHKIMNDLRIGFGGQANRLGISIGHRQKYLRLNSIDTYAYSAGDVEEFAKIDEIILDPYNIIGTTATLILSPLYDSTNKLEAGIYYFKLIGKLDSYENFVIDERQITIDENYVIAVNVEIDSGSFNKRLTDISVYWSDDNLSWYKLYDQLFSKEIYEASKFKIDDNGNITIIANVSTSNLNDAENAIKPSADVNDTAEWTSTDTVNWTFSSVNASPTPANGTYCFKVAGGSIWHRYATLYTTLDFLIPGQNYQVSFKLRGKNSAYTSGSQAVEIKIASAPNELSANWWLVQCDDTKWTTVTINFSINDASENKLCITGQAWFTASWLAVDELAITITAKDITLDATSDEKIYDLLDDLGYSPTLNYAKSWDQIIVTKGRTFMTNPYFTERVVNKIFFSPFSGAGERQYDVITALNFYDLENFDGNDLIGVELLRSGNFLSLKRSSPMILDSDSGRTRDLYLGKGCINRQGIVNVGEAVIYPGENDIHICDDLRVEDLSDKTIRDAYRALTTAQKAAIIAVREEKENAYRMFSGNTTTKEEFIFTKKGWMSAIRYIYPVCYGLNKEGTVHFMSTAGDIYYDSLSTSDYREGAFTCKWKSVPFDITTLLTGPIKGNQRLVVRSVWVRYETTADITLKVYLDGVLARTGTLSHDNTYQMMMMPSYGATVKSCRMFEIYLEASDDRGIRVAIKSIGVLWKVIGTGLYG